MVNVSVPNSHFSLYSSTNLCLSTLQKAIYPTQKITPQVKTLAAVFSFVCV